MLSHTPITNDAPSKAKSGAHAGTKRRIAYCTRAGGSSLILATLLTGWTGVFSGTTEEAAQAPPKPLTFPARIESGTASATATPEVQQGELLQKVAEAEDKQQALRDRISTLANASKAFEETFEENQSIGISVPELAVDFAGKRWIGSYDTQRMDIRVRLGNRSQNQPVQSVVFDLEIYRKGSDKQIVGPSRWLASSLLGLKPSTAIVRSLTPLSDDPFNEPDLKGVNQRDIHLVISPVEIRYRSKRVALQPRKPHAHLAKLEARSKSVESNITDLEKQLTRLEAGSQGHNATQLPGAGVITSR